jgi:uncharacterized membrane protein
MNTSTTPDQNHSSNTKSISRNIEAVAKMENEFIRTRTAADRIADFIARFSGSPAFVLVHIAVFSVWILVNLRIIPGVRPFDPYPFMLLSMVVSLEAIFLATFVLMAQNRMARRADQREHLDLQINLLAEREMTLVLQMLQRMSTRLGVHQATQEFKELSEETSIEDLAGELRARLPEE